MKKSSKKEAKKSKKNEAKVVRTKKSSPKEVKSKKPAKEDKKSKKSKPSEETTETKAKKGKKSAPNVITTSKVSGLKLPDLLASDSFKAISAGFDKIEDDLESHSIYLKASPFVKNALPTGILTYDLMMGGGLAPSKVTVEYGPEKSAKSTRFFTAVTSALMANTLPIVEDAESGLNAGYVDRIIQYRTGYRLDDLVGEQDDAGNWLKPPFIRYYNEVIAQKVFRRMKRSLDLFPDVVESRAGDFFKVWRGKDGSIARREEYDGAPQAAYFIDSAAALVPASVDDNDESNAMAAMARVFAWGFPLIKGRVAAKRVCLFFTNQIRNKPGQNMGDPRYMPGGSTFAHNNDARNFAEPRHPKSAEMGMDAKSGEAFTREKSINGGEDRYEYQRVRNEKNKQYTPRGMAVMRTRLKHDGKPGDGVCETFDCFNFLRSTGQLVKRGESLTLNVEGAKKGGKIPDLLGANGGKLDWLTFKKLVELPENKRLLQKHCRAQLTSGYALQLETAAQNKGVTSSDDED